VQANTNVVLEGEDETHILITQVGNSPSKLKSYCEEIFKGSTQLDFPSKAVWKSKAPTQVCFLAWEAAKGKIPTRDMLKRRNFKLASRTVGVQGVLWRKSQMTAFLSIVEWSDWFPFYGICHYH